MMKRKKLSSAYFEWLCDQVCIDVVNLSHWFLAKALHRKEFYWTVPNDDNRAFDGIALRDKFLEESYNVNYDIDELELIEGPCTMFEMLIALANRCEYMMAEPQIDDTVKWFWELLRNVGLDDFSDDSFIDLGGYSAVYSILDRILERSYNSDGTGGLFPLKFPDKDQRKVEIWYQLSAYLIENYY